MRKKSRCFFFLVCLVAAVCLFSNCKSRSAAIREGYIQVTGGKVWYRITGENKKIPILLLHGGPGYPAFNSFKPLEELGDERLVVYYDQLGCGHSDHVTDTALWKVERFVAELDAVRTALGLKQVHIFGHSWGGTLALEYYLSYPNSGIRSLILASPLISTPKWLGDAEKLLATLPDSV